MTHLLLHKTPNSVSSEPGAAQYAYSSAKKVIESLQLTLRWDEIAVTLEDQLGWHPREETSLGELLSNAVPSDLKTIFQSMGEAVPESGDLPTAAGRRIYRLRNSLVHFRPYQQTFNGEAVDWNRLCEAMASIAWHVYTEVFARQ